ncbi:MAG: PLDc_N domain-containing protein [Clostridia bacterium]|nr:PLDc_N domain-containing protein [Clostridia bacterium]
MNVDLEVLKEYLPLLLPLAVAELALFVWALVHVLTHKSYKHGNRILWLVVIILMMNFVGPILYFILGKEEA